MRTSEAAGGGSEASVREGSRVSAPRPSEPSRASKRAGGHGAPAARAGGTQVSDVQRVRMLRAGMEVVNERGYGGMSVARITARAGVSRRTFYDLFEDREDCFMAIWEESVARAFTVVRDATSDSRSWREQLRAGLAGLLALFDDEPMLGSVLVIDALAAGPRVLERRAHVLNRVSEVLDRGRSQSKAGVELPTLTAEGVVGAVLAVVHARMLERGRRPLTQLHGPLMGMIVLPYLGAAEAAGELTRAAPKFARRPPKRHTRDRLEELDMRLTYRTLRVLAAIATYPGASNRLIADTAGVQDQGQISKLLTRIEALGLIANTGRGQARGEPNAWVLTAKGEQIEHSIEGQPQTPS
jgi:AcrR family transcriptional regulator/DNA-binding MarR family transcriptional regulator